MTVDTTMQVIIQDAVSSKTSLLLLLLLMVVINTEFDGKTLTNGAHTKF